MAVPKKRTSKTKTRSRKAQWFRKATLSAKKAWSLGCSIAKGKSNSFIVNTSPPSEEN
uniref:Large ribosomal subunit protein bL32c n=1 Tax=Pseudellipsoidion edaphicum TaxID=1431838 RepID=A0A3R5UAL4_9STRA|nr:ribosomal protein L32 [Pseudellipsoidion edaphicum]QAA12041.1 ribosomal protein L32 [Pseudellipsoidion edaphicum]